MKPGICWPWAGSVLYVTVKQRCGVFWGEDVRQTRRQISRSKGTIFGVSIITVSSIIRIFFVCDLPSPSPDEPKRAAPPLSNREGELNYEKTFVLALFSTKYLLYEVRTGWPSYIHYIFWQKTEKFRSFYNILHTVWLNFVHKTKNNIINTKKWMMRI